MLALVRPHSTASDRRFPPVERLFAADAGGSLGARVLALAGNPFRFHLTNPPARRFRAVLWLYRAGIEAEVENRWARADYFWDEARRHVVALARDRAGLVEAVARVIKACLPDADAADADAVAARWFDEVCLDTHAGFFNARAQRPGELPLDDRAFAHAARLRDLGRYSALTPPEAAAFLRPERRHRAELLKERKRWPLAVVATRELLDAEPDDAAMQDEYVGTVFRGAVESLGGSGDSEGGSRQDAAVLEDAILALEAARPKMTRHADLYDALGQLCLTQSIRWANGGRLPKALLSVQKALTIRPSFEEAEKVRTQLTDMMNNLQARVQELEKIVRSKPNAVLNTEGLTMQANAREGFGPMHHFADSNEARELAQDAQAARNRVFWRNLGLPAPAGDWDAWAARLIDAVVRVAARRPDSPESVSVAWSLEADAGLHSLDARKVEAFLCHRLLGTPWEPARQPARPPDVPPAGDLPLLPTRGDGRRQGGGVPFRCWCFSRQDTGMKLRWAAVVALAVLAGFLWRHEARESTRRARAFAALTAARAAHDDRGVMTAADAFLSAAPFAPDGRTGEVVAAYRQSLVSWFNGLPAVSPDDAAAVARFRALTEGKSRS